MAIAFNNLGSSATPDTIVSSASSIVTSSWSPPTTGLIIAFVGQKRSGGVTPSEPTSITGNGITWVKIGSQANTSAYVRVTIFAAKATGATTGATTVNLTEEQFRGFVSFIQATGVDLAGTVAQAFVQTVGNTADAASSCSITLSAAGNSGNRPISAFILDANDAITPRTNWTEADVLTDSRNFETQYRSSAFETTASASIAGTNYWAGIAAELKMEITSVNYPITAAQGTYTLTGQNSLFHLGWKMLSAYGSFTLTGQASVVKSARKIVSDLGSFTLTGQSTAFFFGKLLTAVFGSFSLTGQTTNLTSTRKLIADVGSYVWTGFASSLRIGYGILMAMGTYTLTGSATLFSGARKIVSALGSFTLTGQAASLVPTRLVTAVVGLFSLVGGTVRFLRNGTSTQLINDAKVSASLTNSTKQSASLTNQSKQ